MQLEVNTAVSTESQPTNLTAATIQSHLQTMCIENC